MQPGEIWWRGLGVGSRHFIRGSDTLRIDWQDVTVARSRWSGTGDTLRLLIEVHPRNPTEAVREDTLSVLASGRVTSLNGQVPGRVASYLYDVLPRLPEPPRLLRTGMTWEDSLHVVHHPPASRTREVGETRLRLRVTRELDTLGTRAIEVVADGTYRLRVAEVDSASGDTLFFDGRGPRQGRWYFDRRRGSFLGNLDSYEVRGSAWTTRPGMTDTVPAVQSKRWANHQVARERAARMIRPLPRGDTLVAEDGNERTTAVLVAARAGDAVSIGMMRDDGSVGTATAAYGADGAPNRVDVEWTDSTGAATGARVVRDGDSLTIGEGRARVALPVGPWAAADEGMHHLLVPLLRRLPPDRTTHTFALYRPTSGRWERASTAGFALSGGSVWSIGTEGTAEYDVLVIDDTGDLLGFLRTTPDAVIITQAAPRPGSPRYARYEQLTAQLAPAPER